MNNHIVYPFGWQSYPVIMMLRGNMYSVKLVKVCANWPRHNRTLLTSKIYERKKKRVTIYLWAIFPTPSHQKIGLITTIACDKRIVPSFSAIGNFWTRRIHNAMIQSLDIFEEKKLKSENLFHFQSFSICIFKWHLKIFKL